MRTVIGLRAAICLGLALWLSPAARAIAVEASPAEVARPSVEELAIPSDERKSARNPSKPRGKPTPGRRCA